MQSPRQDPRHQDHQRREQRAHEEAHECDSDGRDDELRDEPEQELGADGAEGVDDDGQTFADFGSDEAEEDAASGDAEPKSCCCETGGEGVAVADLGHEDDDVTAGGDCMRLAKFRGNQQGSLDGPSAPMYMSTKKAATQVVRFLRACLVMPFSSLLSARAPSR